MTDYLLSEERSHVENLLQPIKNSQNHKGETNVSNGGNHHQRRSLIKFMVITDSGPMFLKSIKGYSDMNNQQQIIKLEFLNPSNPQSRIAITQPINKP